MRPFSIPFVAILVVLIGACVSVRVSADTYAILVGVDSYANYASLSRAGKDVRRMAAILQQRAGATPSRTVVMDDQEDGTNRFPTGDNIRAALAASCAATTADDRLVVMLSGRAAIVDGQVYLVPGDGDPTQPETLIAIAVIRDTMTTAKAETRLLILDMAHADAGELAPDPLPGLQRDFADAAIATWVMHSAGSRSAATADGARWLAAVDLALVGFADVAPEGDRDGTVDVMEARRFVDRHLMAQKLGATTIIGKTQTAAFAPVGDDPRVQRIGQVASAWAQLDAQTPPVDTRNAIASQYATATALLTSGSLDKALPAHDAVAAAIAKSQAELDARRAAQAARTSATAAAKMAQQIQAVTTAPADFTAGAAQMRNAETAWQAGRVADAAAAWHEATRRYGLAIETTMARRYATAVDGHGELLATYGGDAWAAVLAAKAQATAATTDGDFVAAAAAWEEAVAGVSAARAAAAAGIFAMARSFDTAEGAPAAIHLLGQLLTIAPEHAEGIAMRRRLLANHGFTPGQVVTTTAGIRFAYIPPGTFDMGSPEDEFARENDEPRHAVTISHGYFMSVTEVTQAQFLAVMGEDYRPAQGVHPNDRDHTVDGAAHPKTNVTWNEAVLFCRTLGERDGRHYRLPTEAEWEYACRAGSTTAYANGTATITSRDANVYDPAGEPSTTTVKVGAYTANKWGLHDMHGNVWEWCADVYGAYPTAATTDPVGPDAATKELDLLTRVLRGGSWYDEGEKARSANRWATKPTIGSPYIGMRIVLEADTAPRDETEQH